MKKFLKKCIKYLCKNTYIKNYIIMESRPDFSDNTKRVFDYLIDKKLNKKYKIIWLINNKEIIKNIKIFNVKFILNTNKLRKYYYIMHAKYLINCNLEIPKLNQKTISINLWHGTILKRLENLQLINSDNIDYCLCPSEFYLEIYEKQLHVPKEKLIIMNNPRNDYLFSKRDVLKDFFDKDYSKYIMWMPTFRKTSENRVDSNYNFSMGIPIIQNENDINMLNETLKANNIILVIKPHFVQDLSVFKVKEFSNIKIIYSEDLIKQRIELYEFLGQFDALITDYSSVYLDFLITNKPIAFTVDDILNYSENKGFIFENLIDYMPGMKISNIEEMKMFINNLKNDIDEYKDDRIKLCKLVNTYKDDKNAERVVKFLNI